MKVCDKCFAETPDDSPFCTQCGAPLAGSFEAKEGADREVHPELARVNLQRMRGELQQAERDCLAILRRYPNNATANILMGDILVDLARFDDAVNCYETALDVDPTAELPKARLAHVQAMSAAAAHPAQVVEPAPPAVRFWSWAVFVAVALLVGMASYVAGRRLSHPASDQPPGSIVRPLDLRRPSSLVTATDRDAAVLQKVASQNPELASQVASLSFDPQSATLSVVRVLTGTPTRLDVLRAAVETAEAMQAADSEAAGVRVKLTGTVDGSRDTLFMGGMPRSGNVIDPTAADEGRLIALFDPKPWWNPKLATSPLPPPPDGASPNTGARPQG